MTPLPPDQARAVLSDREMRDFLKVHSSTIYRYAFHLTRNEADAQDLFQEICTVISYKAREFRRESEMSTWLYKIAVNSFIDMKRRRRGYVVFRHELASHDDPDAVAAHPWSEGTEEAIEAALDAELLLSHLPRGTAEMVRLSEIDDLCLEEIAKIMQISNPAVFRAIKRALGRMARLVSGSKLKG